jgi:hypothetical protein
MRWLVLLLLLISVPASAHKPSDAHLQIAISGDHVGGTLAVAIRDLDGALDLDADGNGAITWSEVTAAAPRIAAYETERLLIGGCTIAFGSGVLVDFSDGAYWTVPLDGHCDGAPDRLEVTYKLLFDIDAQHRGIVQIAAAHATETYVARSATPHVTELQTSSAIAWLKQGLFHAFTVPQHMLVLILLLLPLGRRRDALPTAGAFLLGAATTLAISATNLIHLPGHVVELVLALTAIIAAVLNFTKVADRWDVAFELGLANGLGFALWLSDLDAPHALVPLGAFAVGITLGLGALAALVSQIPVPRKAILAISAVGALLAIVWISQIS